MTAAGTVAGDWFPVGGAALLAHAGAVDESASVVLLFAALWIGWVGWSRVRRTGFPRLPGWTGPALLAAAAALALAAATVPRALLPASQPGGVASGALGRGGSRPSSTALLEFPSLLFPLPPQPAAMTAAAATRTMATDFMSSSDPELSALGPGSAPTSSRYGPKGPTTRIGGLRGRSGAPPAGLAAARRSRPRRWR